MSDTKHVVRFRSSSGNTAFLEVFTRRCEGEVRIGADAQWERKPSDEDIAELDVWFSDYVAADGIPATEFQSRRSDSAKSAKQQVSSFLNFGDPDRFGGDS